MRLKEFFGWHNNAPHTQNGWCETEAKGVEHAETKQTNGDVDVDVAAGACFP